MLHPLYFYYSIFATLLILLIRFTAQIVLFPGSFILWRRNIESFYCKHLSKNVMKYANMLTITLQHTKHTQISSFRDSMKIIQEAYEVLTYVMQLYQKTAIRYPISNSQKKAIQLVISFPAKRASHWQHATNIFKVY